MAATGKAEIRALMLRLPKGLHRLLVRGAKKADHSLNSEIVRRLELSFNLERELEGAKSDARFAALNDAVNEVLRQADELQKMGPLGALGGMRGVRGLLAPDGEDEK